MNTDALTFKTDAEIEEMELASQIALHTLHYLHTQLKSGITTHDLDMLCRERLKSEGAEPAILGYHGFPGSICTSVNNVICHGIPSKDTVLQAGDIIKLDVVARINGWCGDVCRTFVVEANTYRDADKLKLAVDSAAITHAGIKAIQAGFNFSCIARGIQIEAIKRSRSVVFEYGGHGLGKHMHELPFIASYELPSNNRVEIKPGMVFTVEPMINEGARDIVTMPDKWTVVTKDGSLSAQTEETVAIMNNGTVRILTR